MLHYKLLKFPRRVITTVTLLMGTCSIYANCTMEQANTIINEFYLTMDNIFKSHSSTRSYLILKEDMDPLLPTGWRDEEADVYFPNEPHRLFDNEFDFNYLSATKYFSSIDHERLGNIATDDEHEIFQIQMKVVLGRVEPIPEPTKFDKDPAKREPTTTHWRMKVQKTYTVKDLTDEHSKKNKVITLNDNIAVRVRDSKIVRLRNECGGSAEFSADEINYEGLILEATDAWKDGRYEEAYRLFYKVITLKPKDPPARACFHLGLMMYDQYKGRAVYNSSIDKKTAGKYAVNYFKKGYEMNDEPHYGQECWRGYYNLTTPD